MHDLLWKNEKGGFFGKIILGRGPILGDLHDPLLDQEADPDLT